MLGLLGLAWLLGLDRVSYPPWRSRVRDSVESTGMAAGVRASAALSVDTWSSCACAARLRRSDPASKPHEYWVVASVRFVYTVYFPCPPPQTKTFKGRQDGAYATLASETEPRRRLFGAVRPAVAGVLALELGPLRRSWLAAPLRRRPGIHTYDGVDARGWPCGCDPRQGSTRYSAR